MVSCKNPKLLYSNPDCLIIASGSEVSLAMEAHEVLLAKGIKAQIVSMPSCELFEDQSEAYQDSVIPQAIKARVVVEAGIRRGWEAYLGEKGEFIGMKGFGASAPAKSLFGQYGITTEAIVQAAQKVV